MSFDLEVWSVGPFTASILGASLGWEAKSAQWIHRQENSQISVWESQRVLAEDIPEDLIKVIPEISWLTHLTLEGTATVELHRLIRETANQIASESHGIVYDPQKSSFWFPKGLEHGATRRSQEEFDVVSLSWWFTKSPVEDREGREELLILLDRFLPEALPERYGLGEPPQNIYAETGRERFLDFLDEHRFDHVVWYPNRTTVMVHLSMPLPTGAHRLGFRVNHFHIEVMKAVLSQPERSTALHELWHQISALVRPIYGQVRVIGGYRWMGATVTSRQGGIGSWWWMGIPAGLGKAVVLGEVYQKLWPEFLSQSTMCDGLAFASLPEWTLDGDLTAIVGEPPPDQTAIIRSVKPLTSEEFRQIYGKPYKREYPSGWPFGNPFL